MDGVILAAFLASFGYIFLKAAQQLHVVHDQYALVLPTSFLMAVCEVYVIANIAIQGWYWPLIIAVGTGSGLGCMFSMWVHRKWMRR